MKSKQKAKLILIILGMILVISAIDIKTTTNRTQVEPEIIDTTEQKNDIQNENPSSSGVDYIGVNKIITAGEQENPWNESGLEYIDLWYDATEFARISEDRLRDRPHDIWWIDPDGHRNIISEDSEDLYTTDGKPVKEVLRYNDDKYFFDTGFCDPDKDSNWGMGWDDYSDPFIDNPEFDHRKCRHRGPSGEESGRHPRNGGFFFGDGEGHRDDRGAGQARRGDHTDLHTVAGTARPVGGERGVPAVLQMADHLLQPADGAAAARFLNEVKAFLEAPSRLIIAP